MKANLTKPGETAALAPLTASARAYAAQAKAPATRKAYRASWEALEVWSAARGVSAADPGTVAIYLAFLADSGRRLATIEKALAGLAEACRAGGLPSPRDDARVREVLKGIRRSLGVASRQVDPISPSELRAMVRSRPDTLLGLRDRALLLLGFAGAFRRSELVGLDVGDVAFGEDGLTVTCGARRRTRKARGARWVSRSAPPRKRAPFGRSVAGSRRRTSQKAPLFRPARGLRVGPARLSDKAVARLVKRAAKATGLDPARLSGHSLRSGLATAAAKAGKSERSIMAQTGHRSAQMVRRYIRDGELFTENAAAGLL